MERLVHFLRRKRVERESRRMIEEARQDLITLFESGRKRSISSDIRELINSTYKTQVTYEGSRVVNIGATSARMALFRTKFHDTFYLDGHEANELGATIVFTLDSWSKDLSTLAVSAPNQKSVATQDPKIIREVAKRILNLSLSPQTVDGDLSGIILSPPHSSGNQRF